MNRLRSIMRQPRQMVIAVATLCTVFFVLVGLFFLTRQVNEEEASFDNRNQAYVASGGVAKIELGAPSEVSQVVGQRQRVPLRFSTQSAPVDAVQVVVEMRHATLSDVIFAPSSVTGLELISSQTEAFSGGKRFLMAFSANPLGTPYNSGDSQVVLGHFEFIQPQGEVTLEFHTDTQTIAPNTGNDSLAAPIPRFRAYGLTATPTPTAVADARGVTVLACNSACSSHAQCEANSFCHNGRCRKTACAESESCSCATPTPRASTIGTNTSALSGQSGSSGRDVSVSQGEGMDEEDSGWIFDPEATLSADPTSNGEIPPSQDVEPTNQPVPAQSRSSGRGIVGTFFALGSLSFLLVLIFFFILLWRRRRKKEDPLAKNVLSPKEESVPTWEKSENLNPPVPPESEPPSTEGR